MAGEQAYRQRWQREPVALLYSRLLRRQMLNVLMPRSINRKKVFAQVAVMLVIIKTQPIHRGGVEFTDNFMFFSASRR